MLVDWMDLLWTCFARDPFGVATERDLSTRAKEVVSSTDKGKFILKLLTSLSMAQELRTSRPAKFWIDIKVHQFPNVKKVAIVILSMFESTYTCESSFSHINSIKRSSRCSLTASALHQCLQIALTSFEPKITAFVQNKKCHFSLERTQQGRPNCAAHIST